jgi:hypothetical protein
MDGTSGSVLFKAMISSCFSMFFLHPSHHHGIGLLFLYVFVGSVAWTIFSLTYLAFFAFLLFVTFHGLAANTLPKWHLCTTGQLRVLVANEPRAQCLNLLFDGIRPVDMPRYFQWQANQ